MSNRFLEQYKSSTKDPEVVGVPNITMNAPVVPLTAKGDIGLEFEVEARNNLPRDRDLDRVRASKTKAQWVAKTDGSLRGNAMEYVVSNPILLKEVDEMVDGLFQGFQDHGTIIQNSNRCSTHVHINVGGLKVNQLSAIIAMWCVYEEVLIRWCGEKRVNNHFALSNSNANTMLGNWESFLRTGQSNWRDGKYSALNINTLWTFGSFEFRCGDGASDAEYPKKWAKFLYNFVRTTQNKYQDLFSIGQQLSEQGAYSLFEQLCEDDKDFFKEVVEPYSEQEFNHLCLLGFRNVQSLVYGFPWNDWLPMITKEYVPSPFGKPKKKTSTRLIPTGGHTALHGQLRADTRRILPNAVPAHVTIPLRWVENINNQESVLQTARRNLDAEVPQGILEQEMDRIIRIVSFPLRVSQQDALSLGL